MMEYKEQELVRRMAFASELHETGVEEETLLSQLYCRFLPNTDEKQGDFMARHVLEQIRQFDVTRKSLLELGSRPEEERTTILGEHILRLMEGFVVTSQCRKLRSLNQAMAALDDLCSGTCTLEETLQREPAGYKGNTGEKGRNEELRAVLKNLFAPLDWSEVRNGAETVVVGLRREGMEETLYRGILTVSLYTLMVNGAWASDLVEIPVPIEYVAVAVCCLVDSGETDQQRSAVVKAFLMTAFLAGGTATVMLLGSAVASYAAYFLTARMVRDLICSGKREPANETKEVL